jgi:hypothetical protein
MTLYRAYDFAALTASLTALSQAAPKPERVTR